MLSEDALHQAAEVRADVFADGPVDLHVLPDGLDQFAGDVAQRLVAEDLHGAVVRLERVVEGEFVFGEAQLLASGGRLAHVAGELEQDLEHLCGLDRPVPVSVDRLLEHLGERPRLHDVLPPAGGQFPLEQLLQQLDGEVALSHAPHFGQEFLGEDGDVRLLEARRGEDVDHVFRGHRPRDDLADGVV